MKDAWTPVIGALAVAVLALAAALVVRLSAKSKEPNTERMPMSSSWSMIAAILVGAAVAIAADRFGHLDWYFAIPLGALSFGAARLPAYRRTMRNPSARNRHPTQ
ncbi:membrane hypothetical protein [Bradyrhizobium sp. STM 3843]|nr:membrane hypothetical protein [Bradyrhizobium sp. STM 3843]